MKGEVSEPQTSAGKEEQTQKRQLRSWKSHLGKLPRVPQRQGLAGSGEGQAGPPYLFPGAALPRTRDSDSSNRNVPLTDLEPEVRGPDASRLLPWKAGQARLFRASVLAWGRHLLPVSSHSPMWCLYKPPLFVRTLVTNALVLT